MEYTQYVILSLSLRLSQRRVLKDKSPTTINEENSSNPREFLSSLYIFVNEV